MAGDKSSKIKSDLNVSSFETPFGTASLANLAAAAKKDSRLEEYEDLSEKVIIAQI